MEEIWVGSDDVDGVVGRSQVRLERPVEEAVVVVGDPGSSGRFGPSDSFLLRRCGGYGKDKGLGGCRAVF